MPHLHIIPQEVLTSSPSAAVASDSPGEYRQYLARQMRPMIRALMFAAVLVYGLGTSANSLLQATPQQLPLWVRLAPMAPLLLVAVAVHFARRPWMLSALMLSCILLLQIGFNLNSIGHIQGQSHVTPGLLLPVVCSIVWLAGWDFVVAMALCALGPVPMLLLGPTDSVQIIQYSIYMAIAIAMAAVIRTFTARILLAQFRLERQLRDQIHTDGLTGVLRRNRFLELAQQAIDCAREQRQSLCLIFLDVDHFKPLNDGHGHAAGDTALMSLSSTLRTQTRRNDLIGRIGGEEFALLLPDLDLAQAATRAEQLRRAVHDVPRPDGHLTISIGLAEYVPDHDDIASLLARADQAMRHAKSGGRDRVVTAANG